MLICLRLQHMDYVTYHGDAIKWKYFPRCWPFARGIYRSPVNSPHKGQWRGALMVSLICAWLNGWENNGEADDLRRHRTLYDVTVMSRKRREIIESAFFLLFIQHSICFAMDKTRIAQIKALLKWKYSGDVSPWIPGPGQSLTITQMLAVRRCLKCKCGSLAKISNVENPGERLSKQK